MTKRIAACLLAALCLLPLGPVPAESATETYTYPAYAAGAYDAANSLGLDADEAARAVRMAFLGSGPDVVAILPQDAFDAAGGVLYDIGFRLTFAEPLPGETSDDGFQEMLPGQMDAPLRPVAAECLGPVRYGPIVEMGADYLVQAIHYDQDNRVRSELNDETLVYYPNPARPMQSGSGCLAIVDGEVVIAMLPVNG